MNVQFNYGSTRVEPDFRVDFNPVTEAECPMSRIEDVISRTIAFVEAMGDEDDASYDPQVHVEGGTIIIVEKLNVGTYDVHVAKRVLAGYARSV